LAHRSDSVRIRRINLAIQTDHFSDAEETVVRVPQEAKWLASWRRSEDEHGFMSSRNADPASQKE
jgi:hypothetical protein